ncbi:MAG: hypothetical protein IT307_19475, partial [Chloroflexi bacterium]|nr:hypothetical protein [Chloroflexota bacterium]
GGASADDRAFYEAHRDVLLSEPWSRPNVPLEAFWRYEPGIPAELRGDVETADGAALGMAPLDAEDDERLALARARWLNRRGG